MSVAQPQRSRTGWALAWDVIGSRQFASALSLAIVGSAFSVHAIRSTIGWGGLLGILGALVVLAGLSFVAHRHEVEWQGLLPISILVFVGWSVASVAWSGYQWATLAAVLYQLVFAFLAVYLALVRDTIQVVRTVGDVLRVLLSLSLALEVLSGLLIDLPIKFLGIVGRLSIGGPIQGIFGTRNMLGFVALIALVTFLVELRTRSVRTGTAAFSIVLAVLCMMFSRSPVVGVVLLVVLLATAALYGVRKVRVEHRLFWQLGLAVVTIVLAVLAFVFRLLIIETLNAGNVLKVRYELWVEIWRLIPDNLLQGWGWIGFWRELPPYIFLDASTGAHHSDALNAFLDVYLQLGLIGLLAFVVMCVLAFGRSWLLASNKRSVVYVWTPLVLVVLLATSAAESAVLIEFGWLLLVLCAVKASQGLSWRAALSRE